MEKRGSGTRKTHSKSRNGCGQCKKGRIKCNEQAPRCKHCLRRGLKCDFEDDSTRLRVLQPRWTQRSNSSSVAPRWSASQKIVGETDHHNSCAPLNIAFNIFPTITMECQRSDLLQHFVAFTSDTLHSGGPEKQFWQVDIPQQALHFDYLFNAVLSLSALHRSYLMGHQDSQRTSDLNESMKLHQRSIQGFTGAVTNITPYNEKAAFAMAALTSIYSCGLAQVAKNQRNIDHIDQAIAVIIAIYKAQPLTRPYRKHFARQKAEQIERKQSHVGWTEAPIPVASKVARLRFLNLSSDDDPYEKAVCDDTITVMGDLEMNPEGYDGKDNDWTTAIAPDYLKLLQKRHPMALLILTAYQIDKAFREEASCKWFLILWQEKLIQFMKDCLGPLWQKYNDCKL